MISICIIGGGPSGMMAAISAKKHYPQSTVILIEKNASLGKKLSLTGGGRCNVSVNLDNKTFIDHLPQNGKFLYSAMEQFSLNDFHQFFKTANCPLKEEDHQRLFPKSNKSSSIIGVFLKYLQQLNIKIMYETTVKNVDFEKKIIITNKQNINFDKLIIATGGKSFPKTGSTGDGFYFAKKLHHRITPLFAAEVPLLSSEQIIKEQALMGLSFADITLTIYQNEKKIQTITHDIIFTHFGLSGPASLRASFFIQKTLQKKKKASIAIDFLPQIHIDKLMSFYERETKNVVASFAKNFQLPKRLLEIFLPKEKNLTKEVFRLFINKLKHFVLVIDATKPLDVAFVTAGGISLKEIDPKTLKSKLHPDVSFVGEILDIHGFTGGYNIPLAAITGYVAGKHII